ncbi:unnamed protein product, partial [Rotaria sordida]
IHLRIVISKYANNPYGNVLETSQEIIGKRSRSNDEINSCLRPSYTDNTELLPLSFLTNMG